jgi:hypothetical protein
MAVGSYASTGMRRRPEQGAHGRSCLATPAHEPGQLREYGEPVERPGRGWPVPSPVEAHAVEDLHLVGHIAAPGGTPNVDRPRLGDVPRAESEVPSPQAVVGLLGVQEEGLVPSSQGVEARARGDHHGAQGPVHLVAARVLRGIVNILSEERRPEPAQAERPEQGGFSSQREFQGT